MMYKFERAVTKGTRERLLQRPHPLNRTHGYRPRMPYGMVPQFISNAPFRPDVGGDAELCEQYAAFALGNFCPDYLVLQLPGSTLWAKMLHWEKTRPRTEWDDNAWWMLHNIQRSAKARMLMPANAAKVRGQSGVRRATPDCQGMCSPRPREHGDSDDDDMQQMWSPHEEEIH